MSKIKLYKPTTPARRKTSVIDYNSILTATKPYKKLTKGKKSKAGRDKKGTIRVRHRGSGNKRLLRDVSFDHNFPKGFKVLTIEYDPNRSSFICLVADLKSGDKKYILHTNSLEVGGKYNTDSELVEGNYLPLSKAPLGSQVCQVEMNPGGRAKIVRSAGTYAIVTAKEEKYVTLKLPSGEVRKFLSTCKCSLGRVGNTSHELVRIGKAGRKRRMGIRPTVRGKVMNPVDHPHGGGEARNSIGMKYPKTPWGKHALGVKTRKKKKQSNKFIVSRRKKK